MVLNAVYLIHIHAYIMNSIIHTLWTEITNRSLTCLVSDEKILVFLDLYIFCVTNLSEEELIALNLGDKGYWTEHDNQLLSYHENHLRKEFQVQKLSYFKNKKNTYNI